jgi:hypothetical protein
MLILQGCGSFNCNNGFIIPSKSVTDGMLIDEKRSLDIRAQEFKNDCPSGKFITL